MHAQSLNPATFCSSGHDCSGVVSLGNQDFRISAHSENSEFWIRLTLYAASVVHDEVCHIAGQRPQYSRYELHSDIGGQMRVLLMFLYDTHLLHADKPLIHTESRISV